MKLRNRALFFCLLCVAAILPLGACNGHGGGGGIQFGGGNTPVLVMMSDTGSNQVIEFHATVSSLQLVNAGTPSTLVSTSTPVEFTHLAGTSAPFAQATAVQGTYDTVSVTLTNVSLTFIGASGVVKHASSSQTFTVTPALTSGAVGTTPMVLTLDVNVASSVAIDATDNVTFNTPVVLASLATVPSTISSETVANGAFQDVDGTVVSVGSSSFVFARAQMSGNVTVNTGSSTTFTSPTGTALAGLSSLSAGQVVEVNGLTGTDGSLQATGVEVEESASSGLETQGIITSGASPTFSTLFNIAATENSTAGSAAPALGGPLAISTGVSTGFAVDTDQVSTTGFTFVFDATHMALGQNIEADTTAPSSTAFTADRLKLQQQALQGTVANTSTEPTGTLVTLTLPADSFLTLLTKSTLNPTGVTTINVHQTSATFVPTGLNVIGGTAVRVRGLMFWDGTNYQLIASSITTP